MVDFRLVLIVVVSYFTAIEALLDNLTEASHNDSLEEVVNRCTPGKFYKRGCKQCFCNDKQKVVCGSIEDCRLAKEYPKNAKFLGNVNQEELKNLPSLPHQSSECNPGVSYRVHCDSCICLANKNLMCNDVLCPNYDDHNKQIAKDMAGLPCTAENMNRECLNCTCENAVVDCEILPNCIPTSRRDFKPEPPLDPASEGQKCTKGMKYKRDCNRCFCQKDGSLRCTLMRCLKHTEVQRLKKLRLELEKEGL